MLIVEEQSRSKNYGVRERVYVVVHTILFLSSMQCKTAKVFFRSRRIYLQGGLTVVKSC